MTKKPILFIDPPSGWRYGFPKPFVVGKDDLLTMLREAKYPEADIEFAMKHCRYFESEVYEVGTVSI